MIFKETNIPIPFPLYKDIDRPKCKRKELKYWVMRMESLDADGNKIVDFYANSEKTFKLHSSVTPQKDRRKYLKEIAWVQCTAGFINEVRYRSGKPRDEKQWYDGCGVTVELVKLCLMDPYGLLNAATKEVIQKQLRDDMKWATDKKIEKRTTMTEDKYEHYEQLMFESNNGITQLNKNFCSKLIGFIPESRLLENEEDQGLKNIIRAADEAEEVDEIFFKYFTNNDAKFIKFGLIEHALKKYKPGKIGDYSIVSSEDEEKKGVTGKIFFCKAGKDFHTNSKPT